MSLGKSKYFLSFKDCGKKLEVLTMLKLQMKFILKIELLELSDIRGPYTFMKLVTFSDTCQ